MFTLFKKEVRYYLNNPIGYIVMGLFAVTVNFLYMKDIFVTGSVSIQSFFSLMPWIFLVFVPALTMRSFAQEKGLNTIEILLTLPISETQLVVAKFLALTTATLISLVLTLAIPLTFIFLSHIFIPEIIVGYLGCVLLATTFISISLFFSSLTKNQIVSFLSSILVLFLLLGISSELLSSVLPKVIQDVLVVFSPVYHFQNFMKGIVDLRSVYYFLSVTVLFVLFTNIRLKKRD